MSQTYELIVHSDEICRSCLMQTAELKTIFRCDIIDGDILPIPKIYTSVTNLPCSEGDKLPPNLCRACEVGLIESYIFKEKCRKSYNLLQKILKLANDEQTDAEKQTQGTQNDDNETQIDEELIKMENQISFRLEQSSENNPKMNLITPVVEMDNGERLKLEASDVIFSLNEDTNEIIIEDPLISLIRECEFCNETFDNYEDIELHSNQHKELLPYLLASIDFYRCSRCLFVFLNIDDLAEHSNGQNCKSPDEIDRVEYLDESDGNLPSVRLFSCSKNPNNNLYVCDVCQIEFEELINFRNHFDVFHSNNAEQNIGYLLIEMPHFCGICKSNSPFENLKSALHHVYFHQTDFKCPVDNCMIAFTHFMDLYRHTIHEHSLIRNYDCSHCNYSTKSKDELRMHSQKSCKARNFECNECGKMFLRKNTLAIHLRSHTKDRKYICNYCGKSFFQSIDLNNHVRIHTQERPYICTIPGCSKRFKTISQRNGHVDTHNTENNYRCEVCLKSFKSERILHGHKRLHSEPKFKCTQCPKAFSRNYHLSLHTQRKHNHRIGATE